MFPVDKVCTSEFYANASNEMSLVVSHENQDWVFGIANTTEFDRKALNTVKLSFKAVSNSSHTSSLSVRADVTNGNAGSVTDKKNGPNSLWKRVIRLE